jgi:hypothetical protein
MNTLINSTKRNFAVAILSALSTFTFAQTYTPPPATNAPVASSGPTDYGKDARNMKIKKRIISFGFFSPLNQHISFGYDQLMGTDIVFTSQFGIIGPGINPYGAYTNNGLGGGFIDAGIKLFFAPDFVTDGTLRYNSMQGAYFKPQVSVSVFNLNYSYTTYNPNNGTYSTTSDNTHTGIALILNIGKQWILAHVVSLDIYAGVGYSVNTANNNRDYISNYYSYEGVPGSIVGAAGVNIGIPF